MPGPNNPSPNCVAVTNPSWSPDGRWIAFEPVSGPFDATGNPVDDTIWAVHPNGHGLRQITHRVGGTGFTVGIAPGFGADGNADIFVGHFDSHERVDHLTDITRTDGWESSPRWGTAPLIP